MYAAIISILYEEKNKLIRVRFMSYLVITSVLSGMTAARMTDIAI